MVTTLYLIRHGTTDKKDGDKPVKRYKGSLDIPLSERGIQQIRQLSDHIRMNCSEGFKAIYSSPLIRALKSAEIIAEPYGISPVVIADLRERSFGIWEGMTFTEIQEKYPDEFDAWANNPLKYSPLKGESTLAVRDRVIKALDEILSRHNGELIAIVAHGGVNRIILCHILGLPLENLFRIEQDYASLNIIEIHDKYPVVKLINGIFYG